MKKMILASLSLIAAYLPTAADLPMTSQGNLSQNLNIIHVYNVTDHDLQEFMQGDRPEMVVEFSAQTTLPIHFFLKGDLINLIGNGENSGALEIKQTFYARFMENELRLSSNLTNWKPFLEFITGTASILLTVQEGKPSILLGSETNLRL